MESLNQLELQNIRHIHGFGCNICDKLEYYKTITSDDNTTKLFDKVCDEMKGLKDTLSGMI